MLAARRARRSAIVYLVVDADRRHPLIAALNPRIRFGVDE